MFKMPFLLKPDEPMSPHLIAVDTEYHCTDKGVIDKVFCAVFTVKKECEPLKVWFDGNPRPTLLSDVAKHFEIENPIFVCHAFEKAEFKAFRFLDAEPEAFRWFDTCLAYRLNAKSFGLKDSEDSLQATYAAMCKALLGVEIDTEHKEAMRRLCIEDKTEGHEQEIMDYCYDDTRYLIPCVQELYNEYRHVIDKALQIKLRTRFELPLPHRELWMRLQDSNRAFACIAERGLPVSVARCDAVKAGARAMYDRETRNFIKKYPGSYTLQVSKTLSDIADTDNLLECRGKPCFQEALNAFKTHLEGYTQKKIDLLSTRLERFYTDDGRLWKRDDKVCQKYLEECLKELGLLDTWPRTPTGALSTKAEDLKIFKISDGQYCFENFAADYARLSDVLTVLSGVSKNWMDNLDRDCGVMRYESMRPFKSVTGRAQPSPKAGFVPLWSHSLYCVLEPPVGKWLVELDYSSEETFIQAQVYKDSAYNDAYHSKDMYLWMGVKLGVIPQVDYDAMSVDELKHKYKDIRKRLKTFTLAQSYGGGVKTLAMKSGLPLEQVEQLKKDINTKIFSVSTAYKQTLGNRIKYGGDYTNRESSKYSAILLESGYFARLSDSGKMLSMMNFPIQGTGGQILQSLVIELELLGVKTVCSIHDAVMFLVDEGDYNTIHRVADTMRRVADYTLGVKEGQTGIKVGEPIILKHGDFWHEDDSDYLAGLETLRAGGFNC